MTVTSRQIFSAHLLFLGALAGFTHGQDLSWYDAQWWQCIDSQPVDKSWSFSDDEIRLDRPRGGSGSIVTPPLPPNFELSWKYKIEAKTNTGLKYRVRKFGGRYLGVEYQIIDDAHRHASGKGSTASIYDLVAPIDEKPLHPAGQWNEAKVVAVGDRLEHFLNGKLVSSISVRGPHWDSIVLRSKFAEEIGFGRPMEGDRIMLTDHGGKAVYRDFHFVVRQAPDSTADDRRDLHFGNGIRNSWADDRSIVLWTRTTKYPGMVSDGPRFVTLSRSEAGKLGQETDQEKIHAAQIPAGVSLDEMFGACPGMEGEVRLTYFPKLQRNSTKSTPWQRTTADNDFTAQWHLSGLQPNKVYAAVIEARLPGSDEVANVIRGSFQTAPNANQKRNIQFCVTTCHDFYRRDDGMRGHKIYPAMSALNPDFVVHAGDIEYYDKPDPWAMTKPLMRFKWGRLFALPSNREFYQHTTSYFIKDDHDTLKNDSWPGQRYGSVTFDEGVALFNNEQFPSRDPRYQTVRWGRDLQIWILEGRDYRSPNTMEDGPDKTILGDVQKRWLFQTLRDSDARFKLIFSPTPIVGPDRANKRDNHANDVFLHEGRQLRDELAKHEGLIVLCGDRHWQYASVDNQTGIWEFGCGPGSEKHQFGWKKGDERPVHRFLRVDGGFLSGELNYDGNKSTLTLRHRTVDGKQVSEFDFPIPASR